MAVILLDVTAAGVISASNVSAVYPHSDRNVTIEHGPVIPMPGAYPKANSLYPVFSVETPEGAVDWRAPNEYTDAPFDNLRPYTVYRDRRGRFCLEPRLRDFFTIVFAVLPILFLGLCAAVFAFGGFAILLGLAGVF